MKIIGLDIGTGYIKSILIDYKKEAVLENFLILPSNGIAEEIFSDTVVDGRKIAQDLKNIFVQYAFKADKLVVTIPENRIYSKVIQMPPVPKKDFEKAVRWEAEQHIPLPMSDVYLESRNISDINNSAKKTQKGGISKFLPNLGKSNVQTNKNGLLDILIVAAQKKTVDNYMSIINNLNTGVELLGIEPVSIATTRVITFETDYIDPTIIINLGYSYTDFYLVINNSLHFVRTIKFGISGILRVLMQELSVSAKQSSEYLFTYGLRVDALNGHVLSVISPAINVIINEFEKSKRYVESSDKFKSRNDVNKIGKVVLTGGGAGMPNIVAHFAEKLKLDVYVSDPWAYVDIVSKVRHNGIEGLGSILAPAVGAALRGVVDN